MIIANPIYDVVFKYLMEDERSAKFFIGTLLDETIEEIAFSPQEYAYTSQLDSTDPKIREEALRQLDERRSITVYRLDFIATIKTSSGERKKVLIEIQKAKRPIDLVRFRNYLAQQYKKLEEINGVKHVLPIVTIYLLGFNLPDITTSVIKVGRNYFDLINGKIIQGKSDFVEKLTHDCFVVQLNRIEGKVQTQLGKLLSVFEQNFFVEENIIKEYNKEVNDENIERILNRLHYAGTEPDERKKIDAEREALRIFNLTIESFQEELTEKNRIIEENQKTLEENQKALEENKKLIEELQKKLEDRNDNT